MSTVKETWLYTCEDCNFVVGTSSMRTAEDARNWHQRTAHADSQPFEHLNTTASEWKRDKENPPPW